MCLSPAACNTAATRLWAPWCEDQVQGGMQGIASSGMPQAESQPCTPPLVSCKRMLPSRPSALRLLRIRAMAAAAEPKGAELKALSKAADAMFGLSRRLLLQLCM